MADEIKLLLNDNQKRSNFFKSYFDALANNYGKINDDDVITITNQIGGDLKLEAPSSDEINETKHFSGTLKASLYSFEEFINKGAILILKAFAYKHNIEL